MNIHLRGLDQQALHLLKQQAAEQHLSVNTLLVNMIHQNLGLMPKSRTFEWHDLDALAGTWTKEDVLQFEKNTGF